MMRFPKDPAVVRLGAAMFAAPRSPWASLTHGNPSNFWGLVELVESDLVNVPAFRDLVAASLADRAKLGTLKVTRGGGLSVTLDNGGSMGTGAPNDDPPPPAGTTMTVRACDMVAWHLARREHAPRFQLYWPEARRDAAARAAAAWVRAMR
jgi:hypothetical protein